MDNEKRYIIDNLKYSIVGGKIYSSSGVEVKDSEQKRIIWGKIKEINLVPNGADGASESGGGSAVNTSYDNSHSGLYSTNVQDAIDELTITIDDFIVEIDTDPTLKGNGTSSNLLGINVDTTVADLNNTLSVLFTINKDKNVKIIPPTSNEDGAVLISTKTTTPSWYDYSISEKEFTFPVRGLNGELAVGNGTKDKSAVNFSLLSLKIGKDEVLNIVKYSEPNDLYLDTSINLNINLHIRGVNSFTTGWRDSIKDDEIYSSINPYTKWSDLIKDERYVSGVHIHFAPGSAIDEDIYISLDSNGNLIEYITISADATTDGAIVDINKLTIDNTKEIYIKGINIKQLCNFINLTGTVVLLDCNVFGTFTANMNSSEGYVSCYTTTFYQDLILNSGLGSDTFFYFNTCWGAAGTGFVGRTCPKIELNGNNSTLQMVSCTQFTIHRKLGTLDASDCTFIGSYNGAIKLAGVISDNTSGLVMLNRCKITGPDGSRFPVTCYGTAKLALSITEYDRASSTLSGEWVSTGIGTLQVLDNASYVNFLPRLVNMNGSQRTVPNTLKDFFAGIDDKFGELSSGIKGAGVIKFNANNWESGTSYTSGTGVNYDGTRGYWCNINNSDIIFDPAKWSVDDIWLKKPDGSGLDTWQDGVTDQYEYYAWREFISCNGFALFPETSRKLTKTVWDLIYTLTHDGVPANIPNAYPSTSAINALEALGWHILPNSPGKGEYLVLWFISNQAWINTATLSLYTASNGVKLVGSDIQSDVTSGELADALNNKVNIEPGKGLSETNFTLDLNSKLSSLDTQLLLDAKFNNKVDKISGKALSTNDYTTAEKLKLENLNTLTELDNKFNNKVDTTITLEENSGSTILPYITSGTLISKIQALRDNVKLLFSYFNNGVANVAAKLSVARTITTPVINLASTSSGSTTFDGSANITLGQSGITGTLPLSNISSVTVSTPSDSTSNYSGTITDSITNWMSSLVSKINGLFTLNAALGIANPYVRLTPTVSNWDTIADGLSTTNFSYRERFDLTNVTTNPALPVTGRIIGTLQGDNTLRPTNNNHQYLKVIINYPNPLSYERFRTGGTVWSSWTPVNNNAVTLKNLSVSNTGVVSMTFNATPTSIGINNMQGTAIAGSFSALSTSMTFTPTTASLIIAGQWQIVINGVLNLANFNTGIISLDCKTQMTSTRPDTTNDWCLIEPNQHSDITGYQVSGNYIVGFTGFESARTNSGGVIVDGGSYSINWSVAGINSTMTSNTSAKVWLSTANLSKGTYCLVYDRRGNYTDRITLFKKMSTSNQVLVWYNGSFSQGNTSTFGLQNGQMYSTDTVPKGALPTTNAYYYMFTI